MVGEVGITTFPPSLHLGVVVVAAVEVRGRPMVCMALAGIKRTIPMEGEEGAEVAVAIIAVTTHTIGEHRSIWSGMGGISNSRVGLGAVARMGMVVGEGTTALLGCHLRLGEVVFLHQAITTGQRRAHNMGHKVPMVATMQIAGEEAAGHMAVVIDRSILPVSLSRP